MRVELLRWLIAEEWLSLMHVGGICVLMDVGLPKSLDWFVLLKLITLDDVLVWIVMIFRIVHCLEVLAS